MRMWHSRIHHGMWAIERLTKKARNKDEQISTEAIEKIINLDETVEIEKIH